jgi:hypothetical protein
MKYFGNGSQKSRNNKIIQKDKMESKIEEYIKKWIEEFEDENNNCRKENRTTESKD